MFFVGAQGPHWLDRATVPLMRAALTSADSMSWSYAARRLNGHCGGAHADCRNCQAFAEQWAVDVARFVGSGDEQLSLV